MFYKKFRRDDRIQTGVLTPGRMFHFIINPEGVTEYILLYISVFVVVFLIGEDL